MLKTQQKLVTKTNQFIDWYGDMLSKSPNLLKNNSLAIWMIEKLNTGRLIELNNKTHSTWQLFTPEALNNSNRRWSPAKREAEPAGSRHPHHNPGRG